jgi:hypothetical protein
MQGNHTNIMAVTDKVKEFIGNLGLWVRKLERKSLDMFSRSKDFVEENSVEASDVEIAQCIEDYLVNLLARFISIFQKQ